MLKKLDLSKRMKNKASVEQKHAKTVKWEMSTGK